MDQARNQNDARRPRAGSIILARHGRPVGDRQKPLTWREYIDWWAEYDRSGLSEGQTPPDVLVEATKNADTLYASTLQRAIATAESVADGRPITKDAIFIEAPLPPPPIWGKRNARSWGVWARISWWFGRHAGGESRQAAERRAEAAAATLTARALRGENVALFAHGWFNRMMRPVLKRQGWKCVYDGGDSYWSFRRYEKVR